MEIFAGMAFLVWVAVIGVPISLIVFAWCAYYRLKGMERALWAVVGQLQQMRERPVSDDPVQELLRERQSPQAPGKIANSMFGR